MSKNNYTRRNFIKAIGLGVAAFAFQNSANSKRLLANETKNEKPNIIFILVDDLGWIDTSCYGSKYYETPNIDKLAAEGMRFTDAYAACAVCSPTRAAVMTGRYPARFWKCIGQMALGWEEAYRDFPELSSAIDEEKKKMIEDETYLTDFDILIDFATQLAIEQQEKYQCFTTQF